MNRIAHVIRTFFRYSVVILSRFDIVDETRGLRIADLAWPRIVTGLVRRGKTTADLAMVGIAIGPVAIAGLGFAFALWMVVNSLGWSLASGSMAFFSQRFGADDSRGLDLAVKQTLWMEITIGLVFTAVLISYAKPLVSALGADGLALEYGALYLQVTSTALTFELITKIPSRMLFSANDAWTPMVVRATGGVLNILLNGYFIFILDLGVLGVALGTVIATVAVTFTLMLGLLLGRLPLIGQLPVQIQAGPPYFDAQLSRDILVVATPVMGKQLVMRGSQFFILAIVASFGTLVVAAYATAREIRGLLKTPAWGFATAARSLVGQELGADDLFEADAYGRDLLKLATTVFVVLSGITILFARPIAMLFSGEPEAVEIAVPFIRIVGVSLFALGLDDVFSGIIGSAGDTRWPLYGQLVGLYLFMLPIAFLGTITPLGVVAIYIALVAETAVPALFTFYRYNSGQWKAISKRYRPGEMD